MERAVGGTVRHDNVMADIRKMLNELGLYTPDFSGTQSKLLIFTLRKCVQLLTLTAMYIFALLMLQMFLKSVMPIQAVLILMKLVYIKCISATQVGFVIMTNGNTVETVNARELHAFLEVQTRFNDWIKNRIEQYDFVENQDFLVVTEKK